MNAPRIIATVTGLLAHGLLQACAQPEEPHRVHWTDVTDSAEVRRILEPEPPCEDCITLERVLVMGDTIGPGYLEEAFHMVRDSLGNHWFGQYDAVKVFDAAGGFVGEVGRAGEGPMEWDYAMPAYTDGEGQVHIFDLGNFRHSVVGPDFTLIEEERLPAAGSSAPWAMERGGWSTCGTLRAQPVASPWSSFRVGRSQGPWEA